MGRLPFDVDILDPTMRRPFSDLLEKLLEAVPGRFRLDLDAAVVPVSNPAVDAQALRVVPGEVPEAYALHPALNDHVYGFQFLILARFFIHIVVSSFFRRYTSSL